MALLGPPITVACQTKDCDQQGIERTVHAVALNVQATLLDWPNLTCGSCLCEPKRIERETPQ